MFNPPKTMKDQSSLKPHQAAFVAACLVSVAFWFVPFLRWLTVPLQYLNTHVHEAWHALAAIATGGDVSHIQVHANGNGETYTAGGSALVISSMGYVGAALVGAMVIALAHSGKAARTALIVLAVVLGYSLVVWVRRDAFGMASALGWIVVLGLAAQFLDDRKRLFAAQFLGVQQCLNSIQSLLFLVHISGFGASSDAKNMEMISGIPAIVWALAWCAVSIGLMVVALKVSWRSMSTSKGRVPEWVP